MYIMCIHDIYTEIIICTLCKGGSLCVCGHLEPFPTWVPPPDSASGVLAVTIRLGRWGARASRQLKLGSRLARHPCALAQWANIQPIPCTGAGGLLRRAWNSGCIMSGRELLSSGGGGCIPMPSQHRQPDQFDGYFRLPGKVVLSKVRM